MRIDPENSRLKTRDAITRFLFLRDDPGPVDLCLVLGNLTVTSMDPAIDLYHQGLTPALVISGRGPDDPREPEYRLFAEYARQKGVPAEVLHLEKEARNTRENFQNSAVLIERQFGWRQIRSAAIVGKPYHMRRALMTARRWWPEHVDLSMLPSRCETDLQPHNWWETTRGHTRVMAEIERIGRYAIKGDLRDD